ncbi:MAG: site-2 protease family protein [candidate division Zixibacteria bacterium]|nr:site-2 protease family protein [candidate division Zixibacteria bacterium]
MLTNALIKQYIEVLKDAIEIDVIYGGKEDILLRGNFTSPVEMSNPDILNRIKHLPGKSEVIMTEPKVVIRVQMPGKTGLRKIPWVNIGMFVITLLFTLIAGAAHAGIDYFSNPELFWKAPLTILGAGMPFSFSLLGILLFHEFGHYIASRLHGVKVTLPYFIPFPSPLLGTMGAVIRLKSPFITRKQLLDVGAAGPLAGMVIAIPLVIWGLAHPNFVPDTPAMVGLLYLGDSLLFIIISGIVQPPIPDGLIAVLNPVAFAGWVGFLVTMLNLLPIGQLDGGHILYAMFGKAQHKIVYAIMAGMIILSFWWFGWLIWVILGFFLVKPKHPPTVLDDIPLDKKRLTIGYLCIIIFILCFVPIPFMGL